MTCSDNGMGLAAPQVGVNLRLMVFNVEGRRGWGEELVLVNPKIISSGKQISIEQEACLSVAIEGYQVLGDVQVRCASVCVHGTLPWYASAVCTCAAASV